VISSIEEPEVLSNHQQFLCGIHTAVDVEALSSREVLEWLTSTCGPDLFGPSDFLRDVRNYLFYVIGKLQDGLQHATLDPTKPYLQKYVDWMHWQLSMTTEEPSKPDASSLRERIAEQGFLGSFFLKVADHVLGILKGEFDMMQLIFEDNTIATFYDELSANSIYYKNFEACLDGLSFKYPSMNILEVGAGTGSFTRHILAALSPRSSATGVKFNSYCYTDVSPAFFERARQQFASQAPKFKFATFDAEKDPLEQGFKE
jgi:hypothetical protein